MNPMTSRRRFLAMAGAGAAATTAMSGLDARAQDDGGKIKIIAVACSPRKGKTTATALQVCLDAAKQVEPDRIDTELIELAGLSIPWEPAVGLPLEPGRSDDFPAVAAKLSDPSVGAIVVGSPVYFANMSALCKAFLDRCGMFRRQDFALSGKVGAALAVGGVRSGGQELTIQSVQAALLCQEMIVVGDGRPTGHFGARLWNTGDDDILKDEFGISTAKNLGRHIAEVLLA
jgi:multimeric flavodoxin WrbA